MFEQLETILGKGRIKQNKNISHYLTLRTKTAAEFYFEAESMEDIKKAFLAAKKLSIPFLIIGGGSNLAVTKDVLPGLIVRNLYLEKQVVLENDTSVELLVSSGYPMGRLVLETAAAGWEGFEYHLGLPGTVGGAVYMNSKWTNPLSYIGDNVLYAYLLDKEGEIKKVEKEYFRFAYDYSYLQETKEIVLSVAFQLKKNSPELLKERAQNSLQYRRQTQPHGVATAGCFFQNINGKSAGQMIDQAGLKGKEIGQFVVSDKHANFIINRGEGNPGDLAQLLHLIKKTVKEKFNVDLKEEVVIV